MEVKMGCLISLVKGFLMLVGIITLILIIGGALIFIDSKYVMPDNTNVAHKVTQKDAQKVTQKDAQKVTKQPTKEVEVPYVDSF